MYFVTKKTAQGLHILSLMLVLMKTHVAVDIWVIRFFGIANSSGALGPASNRDCSGQDSSRPTAHALKVSLSIHMVFISIQYGIACVY